MATALEILNRSDVLRTIYLLRHGDEGSSYYPNEGQAGYFLLWTAVWGRELYEGIVIDADYLEYITKPIEAYLTRLQMFITMHAKKFPTEPDNINEIHHWYYTRGVVEFNLEIYITPREIAALSQIMITNESSQTPISMRDLIINETHPSLVQNFDLTGKADQCAFGLSEDGERSLVPLWLSLQQENGAVATGVNLIGFADGVLGLGEDVRALASVLRFGGVPTSICNVALSERHPSVASSNLRSLFVDRAIFPINIFCFTAFETERQRVKRGASLFAERYNIGYWPWELSDLPPFWLHVFNGIDEVWAISPFLADIYSRYTDKPVIYIPPCINVEGIDHFDRAELELEAEDFVFISVFDFNSYVARKNPQGAIQAFRAAFNDKKGHERLVIKTINGHLYPDKINELMAHVDDDPRILLMDGALSRQRISGLIAAADCYVSLHRAEGLGRIIAEAMLLGTPVIATDYSGSTAFLNQSTGFPVSYRLRDVLPGEYPYEEGSQWAEPDLLDAAEMFRVVRSKETLVQAKAARAKALIMKNHGLRSVAEIVRRRLATIGADLRRA
jgi:glycosyltransferase involved in cell wall biosynthesis